MNNKQNRRNFLSAASLGAGVFAFSSFNNEQQYDIPSSIERLKPMVDGVVPISVEERKQRIAKAQQLMAEQKMDAIFMEGTVTCSYLRVCVGGKVSAHLG
jgi:Xaa-Pro dipeptidase